MQGLFTPGLVGQEMNKLLPSLEGIYVSCQRTFSEQYTRKCTEKQFP